MNKNYKIILGILLFLVLITVDVYFVFNFVQELKENTTRIVEESFEIVLVGEIRSLMLLQYTYLDDYIETQNPESLKLVNEIEIETQKKIEEAKELAIKLDDIQTLEILKTLKNKIDQISKDNLKLIFLIDSQKHDETTHLQIESIQPQIFDFDDQLKTTITMEQIQLSNEFNEFILNSEKLINLSVLFYVVLIILHIGTVMFILKIKFT